MPKNHEVAIYNGRGNTNEKEIYQMTIIEKVNSNVRGTWQAIFDKEPVNYLEAGALYGIIAQGQHTLAVLSVIYNHAQDPELRKLIKESMDDLARPTIEHCEKLLSESEAEIPQLPFIERKLHDSIDIPIDTHLTDIEIATTIGSMAKASQTIILTALLNSYQLEVGIMFRKILDAGLDWNYRLLQLMIHRGWLPHLAKVTH